MKTEKLKEANEVYGQIQACKELIEQTKDKNHRMIMDIVSGDYYGFRIKDMESIINEIEEDISGIVRRKLIDVINKRIIDLEKEFEKL